MKLLQAIKKVPLWGLFLCLGFIQPTALVAAERPASNAIASAHPLATQAGREILDAGGNAFDAAITVSAVLAVVEPYSSGIGGGGFWLLHRASDGFEVMLDGRERAPLAAHRDLYLGTDGKVVAGLSVDGALAAGIPGEPAALVHLAENYGRLPLKQTLASAIKFAREGFPVDEYYRKMAKWRLKQLQRSPAAAEQFLSKNELPAVGKLILQPDLANTLQALAKHGAAGFYSGAVAKKLVDGVRAAGGIWRLEDLRDYRIVEREPIRFRYGQMDITSAAPPSSGGIVLAIMLNILEKMDLDSYQGADRKHLIIEAMRRAYQERARYLGDADFVDFPQQRLISPAFAAELAQDININKATISQPFIEPKVNEGQDTTHFSILDREGNRVSATLSINYPFGSAFVPPGTGVLLNDEMDDFSSQPGTPNVYGLVGGEANAIAPGKRMLSSMTPTFTRSEQGVAILGSPGGSRIISMVLHGILSQAAGEGPSGWVVQPRFHHQYLPDEVQFEPGALSASEIKELRARGHHLKPLTSEYGNMQGIHWDKRSGKVTAASDPRGIGSATVW
ncbi:MAG: gamma-glutamyltransferase [Candidatus Polarisedimenticolaceae bacterium]|nr:gamma-glutamyltransferase [Candidatus Polarisedimenticolaceae bacterium]